MWHAVHPLFFIGIFIVGAGVVAGRQRDSASRTSSLFCLLAGAFLVILTGKDLVLGPSPDVAAVRNADAGSIVAFEIGPILGQPSFGDLVHQTIRVTDRARIERLAALLRASTYASPNHPRGGWSTRLRLDDGKQMHSAIVRSTSDGLLIQIGGGGIGRDFRQEALAAFFEDVAHPARRP